MNRRRAALAAVLLAVSACNPPQHPTPVLVLQTTPRPFRDLPAPLQPPTTTTPTTTTTTTVTSPPKPSAPSTRVSSTAYCETGRMANGQRTYSGAVAGNRWPLGTILQVSDGPAGPGRYTVADRIGHGSELDFAIPGDCAAARRWGRRTVTVQVVR